MPAKSRGPRRPKTRTGRAPRAPRFHIEAGEQSLPLQAKVTSVTFDDEITSKEVTGRLLDGEPTHLRTLGQRVTVTSPDGDVKFIVGPDVKKAHTYTVRAEEDPPRFTVVGPGGATFALVYKGVCLYKHS